MYLPTPTYPFLFFTPSPGNGGRIPCHPTSYEISSGEWFPYSHPSKPTFSQMKFPLPTLTATYTVDGDDMTTILTVNSIHKKSYAPPDYKDRDKACWTLTHYNLIGGFLAINFEETPREFALLQNSETNREIPIAIRLWKDLLADYNHDVNGYDKEPVTIIASNLEVKTFHGLSLATRNNTYIIENPPIAEDLNLNKWYADNKHKVIEWLESKAYEDTNKFFPPPTPEIIVDATAAMLAFENVKAKVKLCVTRASLCYVVCENCGMIVNAGADWKLECSGCTVLAEMHASDGETTIRTTIKSPDAEKIFPFSAAEIKKSEDEGDSVINHISVAMDNMEIVCFIKHYDKLIGLEMVQRYVVLKTYTFDEVPPFAANEAPEIPEDDMLASASAQLGSTSYALISPTS